MSLPWRCLFAANPCSLTCSVPLLASALTRWPRWGPCTTSSLFSLGSLHLLSLPLGISGSRCWLPPFWNVLPLDLHTKLILHSLPPAPISWHLRSPLLTSIWYFSWNHIIYALVGLTIICLHHQNVSSPGGSCLVHFLLPRWLACCRCSTESGWEGLMWGWDCSIYGLLKQPLSVSIFLKFSI